MLKQACPEEILNQVQNDTFRVQHDFLDFGFDLAFAMNHVRFMISPELYVVQETLAFDIYFSF